MKSKKEYNRLTKKWEKTTENVGSLKKRETCRGGKEHDFILWLPEHFYLKVVQPITNKMVAAYYESEMRIYLVEKEEKKKLEEVGIKKNSFSHRTLFGPSKHYICTVCGKRKAEYEKM